MGTLANSEDPDEIPHNAAFHQGFHCLLRHNQYSEIEITLHYFGGKLCNRYTMGCPPVRGDNQRALASGLSNVQMDIHGITILYHIHQCRPCTTRDISCSSW